MNESAPPGARLVTVDEAEVTVEKLIAGGDGLARFEGVPLFVPRSAPGDRLRVRITERRPGYGRAEIVEVLEPGPGRREPPCPFFVRCGGCDLQHLEDPLQVELKAAAVVETLERLGRIELPGPPEMITGDPWAYRLRTQLHVDPALDPANRPPGAAGQATDLPAVGYFERGSHDLVAVDRCPILVPELERLLPELPQTLAAAAEGGRPPRRLDLAAGDGGAVTTAPVVPGLPHGEVKVAAAGFTYAFDARSFFQTHRGLLGRLVEAALGPEDPSIERPEGEEWTGETAYDLYCGVGLFTLPLARRYRRVVGVEGDRIAVRFARRNARANGVENVQIEGVRVESWVGDLPEGADRVVADPPRAGLHARVRQALLDRPPARLTYVSCHPATLARDLLHLTRAYRIHAVTLLDLFPQSGHMESVVQLVRS
jgi:23S rRNA (uracil1939-C5)-methyltransferase